MQQALMEYMELLQGVAPPKAVYVMGSCRQKQFLFTKRKEVIKLMRQNAFCKANAIFTEYHITMNVGEFREKDRDSSMQ